MTGCEQTHHLPCIRKDVSPISRAAAISGFTRGSDAGSDGNLSGLRDTE